MACQLGLLRCEEACEPVQIGIMEQRAVTEDFIFCAEQGATGNLFASQGEIVTARQADVKAKTGERCNHRPQKAAKIDLFAWAEISDEGEINIARIVIDSAAAALAPDYGNTQRAGQGEVDFSMGILVFPDDQAGGISPEHKPARMIGRESLQESFLQG